MKLKVERFSQSPVPVAPAAMNPIAAALVAVAIMLSMSGCASFGKSLRNLISGGGDSESAQPKTGGQTRYSDNDNLKVSSDRQYKRMNRQKFEEDSELKEDAGSLWVMEGQGAYLFSQNQIRMVGDLLNVKIDGAPKSQLQTKVRVIAKLLERLDNPAPRGLASQQQAAAAAAASAGAGAPPAGGAQAANGQNPPGQQPNANQPPNPAPGQDQAAQSGGENRSPSAEPPFSVQAVPTRIVEQLKDGSYRVRGMQPFMIGKREYKVIVTGVVRPEDFDDAGIDAGKLLDPQFDIVSSKRGASM